MAKCSIFEDCFRAHPADIARSVVSALLINGALVLIAYAIGNDYAVLPGPPVAHYLLLLFVLILLAYLEGLQVAILALERVRGEGFRKTMPRAYACHALATGRRGMNVQRFLIGRQ